MSDVKTNGDSLNHPTEISDLMRLDWMEDYPEKAIAVLINERDAVVSGHMLRYRIDAAMSKHNKLSVSGVKQ